MTTVLIEPTRETGGHPLAIHLPSSFDMTDDEFFEFCQLNRELRIERTAQGEIIIMSPTGGETGRRNSEINTHLNLWAKRDGGGQVFDSSTGFKLLNGADRAPDASWVKRIRLATLTAAEKKRFIPLCPDFVIELLSPTDSLAGTEAKLEEYVANGAVLGWLIDPETRYVRVYRPGKATEVLMNPQMLSGDPELPGFVLDLGEIWEPNL
ncbi:MAG: Uma2 family endonuclease [Acidobacteria bacterium]|nr:Uma2 family endonuclease [Acidobacteriota bacterium]